MMGPLPPSLVNWLTNSTLVLWPAAAANLPASCSIKGRRVYSSALTRLSTTWRISSTKPSRPTKAVSWLALLEQGWRIGVMKRRSSYSSTPFFRPLRQFFQAEDLEDALEFGVAEKRNLNGSFAVGVTQLDFGAETVAELILNCRAMWILLGEGAYWELRLGSGVALL